MRKWIKIVLLIVLVVGLIPLKINKEVNFYNDNYRVRIWNDKVHAVEILEPLEYDWEWNSENFNESGTLWDHYALFWNTWIIVEPDGRLASIRLTVPGRHPYYKWLGLGLYIPVLSTDYVFEIDNPNRSRGVYVNILSVDYERLLHFGWSSRHGWFCSFCEG